MFTTQTFSDFWWFYYTVICLFQTESLRSFVTAHAVPTRTRFKRGRDRSRRGMADPPPTETFGFMMIDVEKQEHINTVLKKCKNFYRVPVALWLEGEAAEMDTTSMSTEGKLLAIAFQRESEKRMKQKKEDWELGGWFRMSREKNKKNPAGAQVAIGFVLYIIKKDTKNQMQILFLRMDPFYRKQGHGSTLINLLKERHLGNATIGEKLMQDVKPEWPHVMVHFFTVEVKTGSEEISFWRKLGFKVASEEGGWATRAGTSNTENLIVMVIAGPRTFEGVRKCKK